MDRQPSRRRSSSGNDHELAEHLSGLLQVERGRRGTRTGSRALTCFRHAVLVLRWFRQSGDITALAREHVLGGAVLGRLPRGRRSIGERGFAVLNGRWRNPRHIAASPRKVGPTAQVALVLTHYEHGMI